MADSFTITSDRPTSSVSRTAWSAEPSDGINPSGELQPAYKSSAPDRGGSRTPTSSGGSQSLDTKKGCCSSFQKYFRTKDTVDKASDKPQWIKLMLRELCVYVLFLVVMCIVTFHNAGSDMYYFTQALQGLFRDSTFTVAGSAVAFSGLSSREQWFAFTEQTLMSGLYGWDTWYNSDPVPVDETGYIYFENKLLGVPRLRQLRVRDNVCEVNEQFAELIPKCYPEYDSSYEDVEFKGENGPHGSAWTYQSSDELGGASHSGMLASYGGGGYIQDLNMTMRESLQLVSKLKDNTWLDRGTRVVFVDFTVYNANINLFCVIRLTTEYGASGGALTSWTFRTVKLIRYVDMMDFFVLGCEILMGLFVIYYSVEEAVEISSIGCKYFKGFWNILDILVIASTALVLGLNAYAYFEVQKTLDSLLADTGVFPDFNNLAYLSTFSTNVLAIDVFMAWIKTFKYISFNKTMTQLSSTLSRCTKDLFAFAFMFFIVFFAFAQLAYAIFGACILEFNTIGNCFFTQFRIILGDFDYPALVACNRILGPTYFTLYIFFVFFVLLNMFLAIINDTYSEVKEDLSNEKSDFEVGDFFKKGYDRMLSRMNLKRDKLLDIQSALKSADANNDQMLDFDEWRTELKARGYSNVEIETTFAKYDIDGDRVLDADEQARMQEDLEGQKNKLTNDMAKLDDGRPVSADSYGLPEDRRKSNAEKRPPAGPGDLITFDEFDALARRVDKMEESLGCIVAKIDAVLKGLEGMEKDKMKKRYGPESGSFDEEDEYK